MDKQSTALVTMQQISEQQPLTSTGGTTNPLRAPSVLHVCTLTILLPVLSHILPSGDHVSFFLVDVPINPMLTYYVDISGIKSNIQAFRSAGLDVTIGVNIHEPPAWVVRSQGANYTSQYPCLPLLLSSFFSPSPIPSL